MSDAKPNEPTTVETPPTETPQEENEDEGVKEEESTATFEPVVSHVMVASISFFRWYMIL